MVMAKLVKITGYIVLNDDVNEAWNNHPLNKINCTAETCESYFEKGH